MEAGISYSKAHHCYCKFSDLEGKGAPVQPYHCTTFISKPASVLITSLWLLLHFKTNYLLAWKCEEALSVESALLTTEGASGKH